MWKPTISRSNSPLWLAYCGLLFNALAWGLSWWPFRFMADAGLHPLWATALVYAGGSLLFALAYRQQLRQLFSNPWIIALFLSSGLNNAAFNWAVTIGEVIRVVLLFYLMPMWVALLAWTLLGERPGKAQLAQILLALTGAALVMRPSGASAMYFPMPSSWADWLGVIGGFFFALTTVLLRKTAKEPAWTATLAMFSGGSAVSMLLAVVLVGQGAIPPVVWQWAKVSHWLVVAILFGICLIASNISFQYGARRVSSATASLIMLNEILFATVSAAWLGVDHLTISKTLGLACIVLASLVAIRSTTRPSAVGSAS